MTDNGTGFVSEHFLMSNGIKHYTSAPASNGLAERAVQVIKRGLWKEMVGDIDERLSKILINYRITPQTTTGVSPSELLLGRRPRTRLDLLKPHTADRVENQQKAQHDTKAKSRIFSVGETVFVKNYGSGRRWFPGTIVQVTSYQVKLEDGRLRRCHQDQLRQRVTAPDAPTVSDEGLEMESSDVARSEGPQLELSDVTVPSPVEQPLTTSSDETEIVTSDTGTGSSVRTYPTRHRVPLDRYRPGTN